MPEEYKIGLDFGTTNSILSYMENDKLTCFKHNMTEEYIPSFIAYEDGCIEIGTAARNTASNDPPIESYGNFKMRLPLKELDFAHHFQNGKTPMEVTAHYLQELLLSEENQSFTKEKGKIVGLVVSVPEIWQRDIYNLGRERLRGLIEQLGLPLIQLVSEPVAAASYYTHVVQNQARDNNQESFRGNLLVCDMGGGTFDVSLCRIFGNNTVEVLHFEGKGDKDLDCAGVAFDRNCVQIAYQKKHDGNSIDENSPEFMRLLKAFEGCKIASNTRILRKLQNYFSKPDIYGEQSLYIFDGGYSVTYDEVIRAFEPIGKGINEAMNNVKDWLQTNNQQFDRLFLVGGFSQYCLVQKAITEALEITADDGRFDRTFNTIDRAYAISYGTCLIANGIIDPLEKYIHTLGIVIQKRKQQEGNHIIIDQEIILIQGGTPLDELRNPIFYEKQLLAFKNELRIPIWVDVKSQNNKYQKDIPHTIKLPNFSPNTTYYVGMRVDSSQIAYLIIEEVNSKEKVEYELGSLFSQMFEGFFEVD